MNIDVHEYEWVWYSHGTCYFCGRLYPPWSHNIKKIALVRFRISNHLKRPVLICRICLRRFVHIATELNVFDSNLEKIAQNSEPVDEEG